MSTPPLLPRRTYTPDEADRTLPFVRRVVEDIVAEHARWRALVADLEMANAGRVVGVEAPRAEALEREVLAAAARLDAFAAELAPLGVVVQSYELGLVDFPATVEGRPAFLCWRLGEPAVRFWHDRGAGLIGRRPLHSRAA